MLTEYLAQHPAQADTVWHTVMPGVCVYRFSIREPLILSSPHLDALHFETLYCDQGTLTLEQIGNQTRTVGAHDVLLVSNTDNLCRLCIPASLSGILVSVDAVQARSSLRTLCHLMGDLTLDLHTVRHRMAQQNGCALLRQSSWTHAMFATLLQLPQAEHARYCVWKSTELLYLLCTHSNLLESDRSPVIPNSRLAYTVRDIRDYMACHLDEKLTIASLCRRFGLSPTAFKTCFRRMYGQPIHNWLQQKRMEHAGTLLRAQSMTVLQVAQSVGYDGVSQFNAAFKRRYGLTPTQYRKMSDPVDRCPIPQDDPAAI